MSTHASFWEAVVGAVQSLRSSKLRSFLTLLGIILATATLIAVMSVISGMDVVIARNISDMGADGYRVTRIFFSGTDLKKLVEMQRRNPLLTIEEFAFLKSRVTLTRELGIAANRTVTINKGKERSEDVELDGCTPNMAVIGSYDVDEGRYFSETENSRHMNVAFVGHDVASKFLPRDPPSARPSTWRASPSKWWAWPRPRGRSSACRRIISWWSRPRPISRSGDRGRAWITRESPSTTST